jgi:hypothetical protein
MKRQLKLSKAIEYNNSTTISEATTAAGGPDDHLDEHLKRMYDQKREQKVERLRQKMKAVCGPGGSDLKPKKIAVPYSPN